MQPADRRRPCRPPACHASFRARRQPSRADGRYGRQCRRPACRDVPKHPGVARPGGGHGAHARPCRSWSACGRPCTPHLSNRGRGDGGMPHRSGPAGGTGHTGRYPMPAACRRGGRGSGCRSHRRGAWRSGRKIRIRKPRRRSARPGGTRRAQSRPGESCREKAPPAVARRPVADGGNGSRHTPRRPAGRRPDRLAGGQSVRCHQRQRPAGAARGWPPAGRGHRRPRQPPPAPLPHAPSRRHGRPRSPRPGRSRWSGSGRWPGRDA